MAHIQKIPYKSKRIGKTMVVWQARYRAPDGRERTKRFDRKVDAERWLDTNGSDIARGSWIDPGAGRITVGAYANRWLDGWTDLRPTTVAKYRGLLDRHIIRHLGSKQMGRLTASDVRGWHAELTVVIPQPRQGLTGSSPPSVARRSMMTSSRDPRAGSRGRLPNTQQSDQRPTRRKCIKRFKRCLSPIARPSCSPPGAN